MSAELGVAEPKPAKFDASKRGWFLTFPQCDLTRAELGDHLLSLGPEIVVVARETHKSGDFHLHAWCEWSYKKHIRNARFFDFKGYHCNIGSTKKKEQNTRGNALKYILKYDTDPWSFGIDLESWKKTQKSHRSTVAEMIITGKKTVREIVTEFPQELYNMDKLLKNYNLYKVLSKDVPAIIPRDNYWIYGEPGAGKSYAIRALYPDDLFIKSANKWWDGYSGQTAVLLDDYGIEHACLSYYLKIWADSYSFNAEIKGGTIVPYYTRFFITSNYEPEDIWKVNSETGENEMLVAAIRRRFQFIALMDRDEQASVMAKIGGYVLITSFRSLKKYLNNV